MSKIPGFLILMSVCGLHASDEFLPYAGSPTSGLRFKKKQGQEPIPPVSKEVSGQQDSPPILPSIIYLASIIGGSANCSILVSQSPP